MVPGEYRINKGVIEMNKGRQSVEVIVTNTGDRPIQVGSHYHFFEVNRALAFPRELAFGMHLDIPAGTAVRFEPGEQKPIQLVELGGAKLSYGLNNLSEGPAVKDQMSNETRARWQAWEGKSV
ncbi:urease subunit beta [Paenibacillus sp. CGMCC 1.16610]|uniref:Urease subunit beta n=1 Tax=Paenibacillus anseongense TaxID=2682845 RepID=A0ABW9UAE6_9BACL|nr:MULTISPECIES: urease subunit beta [Paenibacillus]MBA2940551.1 urease subunit beta [Paenibacillus sp. CGMCC 1.16610]MVQ35728.1 urease subunit beta [Paenibacillus anseongense]